MISNLVLLAAVILFIVSIFVTSAWLIPAGLACFAGGVLLKHTSVDKATL